MRLGWGTQAIWLPLPEWPWASSMLHFPICKMGTSFLPPFVSLVCLDCKALQGRACSNYKFCTVVAQPCLEALGGTIIIKTYNTEMEKTYYVRLSKLSRCQSKVVPCGTFSRVFSSLVLNIPSNRVSLYFGRLSHSLTDLTFNFFLIFSQVV